MADLHETMMSHVSLAAVIEDQRVTGKLKEKRLKAGLYPWQVDAENFLYGALNGMSYNGSASCNSGLKSSITYLFDMFEFSSVYLPWDTMKFVIAGQKLSEAGNTIYAYLI
jgi:hypothetical protein